MLTLHGRRGLTEVIKDLKMGRFSWNIRVQYNHKGSYKKEADVLESEKGYGREAEVGMVWGMSQGEKAVSRSWKKQGNELSLRRKAAP